MQKRSIHTETSLIAIILRLFLKMANRKVRGRKTRRHHTDSAEHDTVDRLLQVDSLWELSGASSDTAARWINLHSLIRPRTPG
jgi:hypothetical protein